jgi:hypothetical protein
VQITGKRGKPSKKTGFFYECVCILQLKINKAKKRINKALISLSQNNLRKQGRTLPAFLSPESLYVYFTSITPPFQWIIPHASYSSIWSLGGGMAEGGSSSSEESFWLTRNGRSA